MPTIRKYPLVNGEIYHLISRSIAGYKVFNNAHEYNAFKDRMIFYRSIEQPVKFSRLFTLPEVERTDILEKSYNSKHNWVDIICYCIMPTHIHLILKQEQKNGISNYLRNLLDSYSHHFNNSHQRRGPLWEGRFKNILVESDEQLLHLTRYIHLNPCSAGLVDNPENWEYSSYLEYLAQLKGKTICDFSDLFDFNPEKYRKFCLERKQYQREISIIKSLLLENYTA